MSNNGKQILVAAISILVIAGSATWIYWREFRSPKHNVGLHQRVGEAMAEQTAKLAGHKGRVVALTISIHGEPELQTQLTAFRQTLKKSGDYELKEYELDTKDQPKYGVGMGLSGRRFVRMANRFSNAEVLVSFVGAPNLKADELAELTKPPKFVAETRTPDHLQQLFEKKILQVAIVSRFQFPAPGTKSPKTSQEWFTKRYQIITEGMAAFILPKSE